MHEGHRLEERLRRLNDLGFDVDEVELVGDGGEIRLVLQSKVVEPGHHQRRLMRLTGLDAQENQARRMLNDIARYRDYVERTEKRKVPESVVAARWRDEIFEPTIAAVPEGLWARLPAAEVFHQVLEHRWFLSEKAGKDVGIEKAVQAYVESELPRKPAERVVLEET
jgi:hypothetical protein